jgi:hypothetical protein
MSRFRVTSPELYLRPQPGDENIPLGRLKLGAVVDKLGESDKWYFVKIGIDGDDFAGDLYGWASSKYLVSAAPLPEPGAGEQPSAGPSYPTEPFSIDSDLKNRPSPLTAKLIDTYLQSKNSPLAGIGAAVMATAQKYGINTTYILSHAIHETGWGKSHICQQKHNLFGWGAIDSDAYGGAALFASWEECLDVVMGRVNELYLTEGNRFFKDKPCPGNKSYGMNFNYATDPKWGDKIARIAASLEDWVLDQVQPLESQPTVKVETYPPSAQLLLAAIERVNPEQPYYLKHDITGDNKPETFCNWFVGDVLEVMGISLPRYDGSAGYYPPGHPLYGDEQKCKPWLASALYDYFKKGGDGKWKEVNRTEAVDFANNGKLVVASIPGHIALVIPGGHGSEVRIAQAGRCCGKNMKLEEGFGRSNVGFFCSTA